jgi:uncharacterized protein (DUF433 family)
MKDQTLVRNKSIYEDYLVEKTAEKNQEAVINFLAEKFGIGEFYIRNILKQYGVGIKRKERYNRDDKDKLIKRNSDIGKMYRAGSDPDEISVVFGISAARVRQVLKMKNVIGYDFKKVRVAKAYKRIKKDVSSGKSHPVILAKYGKETLRKVKVMFDYNVFAETRKIRDEAILKLYREGNTPADIAEKFGLIRDYVYGMINRSKKQKPAKKKR